MTYDIDADPQRLPDPRPAGARQAARVPRQRRDDAEAAAGDRRARALLRALQREHPPRPAHARRRGDGGVRGGARRRSGRFINAEHPARGDHLHAQHDRVDQPRRERLGAQVPQAGRRDRLHGDGAPQQPRALAAHRAGDRRDAALHRHRRRRASCVWDDVLGEDRREDEDRRDHADVERARHDQPGARRSPRSRTATARSCSSMARRACRTCRSTCATSTATSWRSRRTRCSGPTGVGVLYGKRDAAGRDGPVPRRRRDDHARDVRVEHLRRRCRTSSRPARRTSPTSSRSARRSTTSKALGMDAVREHEIAITQYAHRRAERGRGRDGLRAEGRGRARAAPSRSTTATCTRTT